MDKYVFMLYLTGLMVEYWKYVCKIFLYFSLSNVLK